MEKDITSTIKVNNLIRSINNLEEFTDAAHRLHENLKYMNFGVYGIPTDNLNIIGKTTLQAGTITKYDVIASIRVYQKA